MSKITIPLLLVFAAVGLIAWVKFDRDESDRQQAPAAPLAPAADELPAEVESQPRAPELEESLTGEQFDHETERELANTRLVPLADDAYPVSFLWPTGTDDGPAHPELLQMAEQARFERWKSYTDEDIGFYYPDHPDIRVEVIAGADPLPVLAPALRPSLSGIFKTYRVAIGDGGTLFAISLSREARYDDTERAPQPEFFRRFTPSGGGLLRASFTESGLVRRVEVLGQDLCAHVMDWPQLAVHQEVYLRMAFGIELPRPHADVGELREAAVERYGLVAKLGMLDHGIATGQAIAILGQPAARDPAEGTLQYFRNEGARSIFYEVPVKPGYFGGFGEGWRSETRSAPSEGSVRWMVEKTSYHAGPAGGIGYDLGRLSDADVASICDRIVQLAPGASSRDWQDLCQVVANLAQHGLGDERVSALASDEGRLGGGGEDSVASTHALLACGSDASKAVLAHHLITSLERTTLGGDELENFHTLLGFLGRGHPASGPVVDTALGHRSAAVREIGFEFCDWLPEKFAIPHLEAGLLDPSATVRRHCAEAFATHHGDPGRHPELLASRLGEEGDEVVRELLREAIRRLGSER